MRVVMAADPAGQDYLLALCEALQELRADSEQFEVVPLTGDDWPENVRQVGFLVATRAADRGILTGPTGNGEALMINRIPEARCTVCWDVRSALAARRELNANVLAIARNHIPLPRARRIADLWLRLAFRPRTHHDPERLDQRHPDGIALGNPNGRGRHLSPFFTEQVFVCEWCRAEFTFDLDLFEGTTQDVLEECPVCGQENRILVEVSPNGDIYASGDPDVSH
jgi:RpiB/LacA/LacB family sugar-phosphate isomerase